MHSTEAVFMTTTLLKCCNFSHFLLQLPSTCQSPGRPRFIFHTIAHFELCFLRTMSYSFAQAEPFLNKILRLMFLKYGPHQGGRRTCYVTPDLSYDWEGEKKKGEDNKWDVQKSTCTAHVSKLFRTDCK